MKKTMRNPFLFSILFILGMFTVQSCMNDVSSYIKTVPTAIGKTNEIIVIAEDPTWEGAVGDTFNFYFTGPYPIMPAPEPLFDVRHFTPEYLFSTVLRQSFRTYIVLVDINNKTAQTTRMAEEDMGEEAIRGFREADKKFIVKIGKNKWAKNQIVTYIIGKGPDEISRGIAENFPLIASKINEHDASQINAKVFVKGIHQGMTTRLQSKFGIELKIPQDFVEAIDNEEITWLRKETSKASMNLIFHKIPYENIDQLTPEKTQSIRNELTKKYIASGNEESYMIINNEDLPVFSYVREMGGNYAIEIRGVWEMTDDFMGGPFFSWLFHNKEANELVFVDAFVLSPGQSKRNAMQQLNHLVDQIKFSKLP